MTPREYEILYKDLEVPILQDEKVVRWESVELSEYVLIVSQNPMTWDDQHPHNQAAYDALLGTLWGHFGQANQKKATLTVHFQTADGGREHVEFDRWQDLWYHARKALLGKASPEETVITLQLAARFGLLKSGDVQDYCDTYLGLDCNGFVGNYLVHGFGAGSPWDSESGEGYLANQQITSIVNKKVNVKNISPGGMYLFAMVGANGNVVPGGGLPAGHIFVTNSNPQWPSDYIEGKSVSKVWTAMATESTGGGVGLITAPCQFVRDKDGIFTIKRQSHPHMAPLRFKAFRV
jgi:hypothetical protein